MAPKKSSAKFRPKQRVTAKMPGYSAWPAFIAPDEDIPDDVMQAKNKKTMQYCVIFIPDGDYYWMSEKGLTDLSDDNLNKLLESVPIDIKKKMKNLQGIVRGKPTPYKHALAAARGLTYDSFYNHLAKFQEDDEDEEEEEEEEVEPEHYDDEEEVELEPPVAAQSDDDEEEEEAKNHKPKKRSKSASQEIKVKSKNGKKHEYEDEADYGDIEDDYDQQSKKVSKKNVSKVLENGRKRKLEPTKTRKESSTPIKKIKSETSDEEYQRQQLNKKRSAIIATTASVSDRPPLTDKEKYDQLWLCRVKLQKTLIQRNQPNTPKDTIGLKPPTF
ncbi:hypothetical protein SBY92_003537 [Candida maltosa Xu316]